MFKTSNFDFTLGIDEEPQRHSYRAHVYGIEVRLDRGEESYNLMDISISGCAFRAPENVFDVGDQLCLRVEVKGRVILAGIEARVVRFLDNDIVACAFDALTQKQEYTLDKLVLEIQKRIIALNRS